MANTNFIARAARIWALAAGVVLLAIMGVTSLNTLAFLADRIGTPIGLSVAGLSGYEDFVSLGIAMAALGFLPWCQVRRGHIAIDLVVSRLPRRIGTLLDKMWLATLAVLALFLAYWMGSGMVEARGDNALSPILGWPRWPFFAPGIISLILWSLVCLSQLLADPKPEEAHSA